MNGLTQIRRAVAVLMGGAAVAQLIPAAALPVYARLFEPAQVAVWASFTALSGVASVIMSGRMDLALVLPRREKWAEQMQSTIVVVGGLAAGLFTLLLMIVSEFGRDSSRFPSWLPLVPVAGYGIAVFQSGLAILNRQERYKVIAIRSVIQQVFVVVGVLALVALGRKESALIVGSAVGHCAAGAMALQGMPRRSLAVSFLRRVALLRRFVSFLKYNVPYSILTTLSVKLPVLVMLSQGSSSEAGLAGVARSLVFLPVTLLSASLGRVFFRSAAQASQEESASVAVSVLATLLRVGVVAFALGIASADHLVPVLLGESWTAASSYVIAVAPAAFLFLFSGWTSRLYEVHGRQKRVLQLQVAGDSGSVVLGVAFLAQGWGALSAMWAISVVSMVQSALLLDGAFKLVNLNQMARFRFVSLALALLAVTSLMFVALTRLGVAYLGIGVVLSAWALSRLSCSRVLPRVQRA